MKNLKNLLIDDKIMVKVMKKRKALIVGLVILMGILLNISVYFDNGGGQDNDFALSDLRVSLVNRAYADYFDPDGTGTDPTGGLDCLLIPDEDCWIFPEIDGVVYDPN